MSVESEKMNADINDELGFGSLLKGERKKKGLSCDQVAKITRLRSHLVEALENEEWSKLPAPVYVRGFIRSYAQTVDLDVDKVLEIYERIAPPEDDFPRPLIGAKKTKRHSSYLIILIIGVIAFITYSWLDNRRRSSISDPNNTMVENGDGSSGNSQVSSSEETESKLAEEPPTWKGDLRLIEGDILANKSSSMVNRLYLKAIIRERTWIEIHIDDRSPMEYIFEPGDERQWEAEQGFDILVGNAGGIEFVFNGKEIGDLGQHGKVVRITFPGNFKSKVREKQIEKYF